MTLQRCHLRIQPQYRSKMWACIHPASIPIRARVPNKIQYLEAPAGSGIRYPITYRKYRSSQNNRVKYRILELNCIGGKDERKIGRASRAVVQIYGRYSGVSGATCFLFQTGLGIYIGWVRGYNFRSGAPSLWLRQRGPTNSEFELTSSESCGNLHVGIELVLA